MRLKQLNLVFGLTLFVGFLVTGYYLQEFFKPEHLDDHVMRMQIRANHIYILLISLLNIVSFSGDFNSHSKLSKYLEFGFRILNQIYLRFIFWYKLGRQLKNLNSIEKLSFACL